MAADVTIERDCLWWLHEGNRAIRVGDWKLVAAKGEPWALYNLANDRAEGHDLAAAHPDRVRELAAAWQARVDSYTAQRDREPDAPGVPTPRRKAASPATRRATR